LIKPFDNAAGHLDTLLGLCVNRRCGRPRTSRQARRTHGVGVGTVCRCLGALAVFDADLADGNPLFSSHPPFPTHPSRAVGHPGFPKPARVFATPKTTGYLLVQFKAEDNHHKWLF
jgi:hypothetical protein